MTALIVIRVLGPLALALSPLAIHAAPGHKTMRVYSARMETLFIRLDVNRDGRLDASEVRDAVAEPAVETPEQPFYLLLEDLRPKGFPQWVTPQTPFQPGRSRQQPTVGSTRSSTNALDQSQFQSLGS